MIEKPLAVPGPPTPIAAPVKPPPAAPAATKEGPSFSKVLEAIGRETKRGEALIQRAIHAGGGQELSSGDLIALQAGVYRYVEVVDLASKLVDRVTQSAKTITQGNGG